MPGYGKGITLYNSSKTYLSSRKINRLNGTFGFYYFLKMEETYNDWAYRFQDFNKKVGGKFKIVKLLAFDCFESRIECVYNSFKIVCRQVLRRSTYTIEFDYLIFECLIAHKDSFNLYISPLGFFEKILNPNRFYTEIEELDNKLLIETSDEKIAYKIFKDLTLVNLLLNDQYSILNIHLQEDQTLVTLKHRNSGLHSLEEMSNLYDIFIRLLDVLEELPDKQLV